MSCEKEKEPAPLSKGNLAGPEEAHHLLNIEYVNKEHGQEQYKIYFFCKDEVRVPVAIKLFGVEIQENDELVIKKTDKLVYVILENEKIHSEEVTVGEFLNVFEAKLDNLSPVKEIQSSSFPYLNDKQIGVVEPNTSNFFYPSEL
ncbi:MAG: hypothetical protein Kow0081_3500 [Candidatus Dojkabacteria bacterium]